MVLFGLTAQLIDTLIIKGTVFTVETLASVVSVSVKGVWRTYYPDPLTETESLKLEISNLTKAVRLLEDRYVKNSDVMIDGTDYLMIESNTM